MTPPLARLMGELRVGVMMLDRDGEAVFANAAAERAMRGPARGALLDALRTMRAGARRRGEVVETTVPLGRRHLRVMVVGGADASGYAACVDQDAEPALRAEMRLVQAMLTAVARETSARDALVQTLDVLAAALPGAHVVLYEVDPASSTLRWTFPRQTPPALAALPRTLPLDRTSAAGHSASSAQAVRVSTLAGSPFSDDHAVAGGDRLGALALPVGARQRILGTLRVLGRWETLGEGELRLLYAAADAVGALLDRARQDQALTTAREDAVRRERLAALGRLAAGVAHEVNNPLTCLSVNVTLSGPLIEKLRAGVAGSERERIFIELGEMLHESQLSIERLESITGALRGLARDGSGAHRPFDPGPAVRDAVHVFQIAKKRSCRVIVELAPMPPVVGSPGELGQVIVNLLENGLYAMGAQGTLVVRGEDRGEQVRISVIDTGPGIPPEIQPHLFEPFFTSKPFGEGTGLGLYICHEIVSRMRGRLGYETGAQGTTFVIELPALAA